MKHSKNNKTLKLKFTKTINIVHSFPLSYQILDMRFFASLPFVYVSQESLTHKSNSRGHISEILLQVKQKIKKIRKHFSFLSLSLNFPCAPLKCLNVRNVTQMKPEYVTLANLQIHLRVREHP